jgi:ABC-type nitrate/sulfonate/bicarbonate transport system substrate-binding protein
MRPGRALSVVAAGTLAASCAIDPATDSPPLRVAFASLISFSDVPTLMAHRTLGERGHAVTATYYASPELAAEAMAQGQADFLLGSTRVLWSAALKGVPAVAIVQDALDNNVLAAQAAATSCADLAKARIGLQSQGSSGTILLRAYLAEECPGISPMFLHMPGSAIRMAALLSGALDAAMIQRSDALTLARRTHGRLAVAEDFGVRWPGMVMRATFAHAGFARAHPDIVEAYVESILLAFRDIADDEQRLASEASRFLETDEGVSEAAREYVQSRVWQVDGGLDPAAVRRTVAFFNRIGVLPEHPEGFQFADRTFLDRALDRIGRRSPSTDDTP